MNRSRWINSRFALYVSLFLGSLAMGQEGYQEYTLEDSVTVTAEKAGKIATHNTIATKLPLPLRETPMSVGVVTHQMFTTQGSVVLSDALKNVAGVNCQTGNGVHDYFIIRGFNSLDNGLVLTDGTPEPEVTFYHLYNIERVEVLKGPGAFLYGANPLSGTVNLVRKPPLFEKLAVVEGTFGQFNTYQGKLDANYGSAATGLALRVNALYQQSDFFRNQKDNKSFAVNPAVAWRIGTRSHVHVDYEFADAEYAPDAGIPLLPDLAALQTGQVRLSHLPDIDPETAYETPFDFSDQKMHRLKARFTSRISPHITLRNKFYYTDLDWQSRGTLLSGAFPDPQSGRLQVVRSMTHLNDRQKMTGNQLEATFTFKTGGIRHLLLTGLELRQLKDDFTLGFALPLSSSLPGIPPIDLLQPVEFANEQSIAPLFAQESDARVRAIAPYFINQLTLSRQVRLYLGGRYDAIQYREDRHDADLPTVRLEDDFNRFNPLAGVVYLPHPSVSLYSSIGQSFAPPSTQLGLALNRQAEESSQFEVGIKGEWLHSRLRTNVAYFDLQKDNISIPEGNGLAAVGDQRSRGVEVEVVAEPWQDWLLFVNYAFTDAELTTFRESVFRSSTNQVIVDYSGNRPAFVPEHLLNVWSTREFAGGLGLGGGLRYVSTQFIDEDNVFELDGYVTVDATVYYRLGGVRLGLNFKNLTDTEYFTRGFGNSAVIPADPFATYGSLEIRL